MNCRECGVELMQGSLFCPECGRFVQERPPSRAVKRAASKVPQKGVVEISHNGQRIPVSFADTVWIGRADPQSDFLPAVDLTQHDGLEHGVSRQHATLERTDEAIVLIDKSSANGTWIGTLRLEGKRPYPLQPKTNIRFGSLKITLLLEK